MLVVNSLCFNNLDNAIYTGSFITIFIFWIIDSNSYYYQRVLRIRMSKIVNELKEYQNIFQEFGMPLENEEKASWLKSFFNISQMFYFLGVIVILSLAALDKLGIIK